MADHIAGYGLKVGSFVAPIWGGAGGGSAMGSEEERKTFFAGAQGLRHRQADAGIRHPADRRRQDRFLDQRRDLGQEPGRGHQADRRDLSRSRQDRRGPRRVPRRRGRDLLGRHAFLAGDGEAPGDGQHARRGRLPGRHGAFDALHPGLQRRGRPHPAQGLRLEGPAASSTPPTGRSPTRSARGRSISTSPRTTAPSSAPATTRRPAAIAR